MQPDIHGAIIQLKLKANIALEKRLLNRSTTLDIRQDWIKARRHVLIPLASEPRDRRGTKCN